VVVRLAFGALVSRLRVLIRPEEYAMNDRFREILDSLPDAIPRSCLEPYKELIQELRRRKRPYREIAGVLARECGIRVSHSTLYEFVQRHLSKNLSKNRTSAEDCAEAQGRPARRDEVRERIAALKREPVRSPNQPTTFQFDGTEPLRLKSGKTRLR